MSFNKNYGKNNSKYFQSINSEEPLNQVGTLPPPPPPQDPPHKIFYDLWYYMILIQQVYGLIFSLSCGKFFKAQVWQ